MTPSDIKCRLCQHHYGEAEGCVTCAPAKKNALWPAMTGEDVSLQGMAQKSIRLLQLNLDRLEKEMTQSLGGKSGHYYAEHGREAAALAKALATILGEARKIEDREARKVAQMTFSERIELWKEWFAQLPQEHQRTVAMHMARALEGETEAELS